MSAVVPAADKELTATVKLDSLIDEVTHAARSKALSIVITSDEGYVAASEYGQEIKARHDNLEKERVKLKAPFLSGGAAIDAHYRTPLATLSSALNVIKERMVTWDTEKRRLAELERKRQEEIRRAAEAEVRRKEEEAIAVIREQERLQRVAAEAEASRQRAAREEAEAKLRSEAAAREAAEAQASGDRARAEAAEKAQQAAERGQREAEVQAAQERQRAIDAARSQLKAERQTQAAIEAMEAAKSEAEVIPATVEPVLTHVAGNRRKTVWSAVVREGAEIPRKYLKLDEAALDADVQRFKDRAQEFLGDWVIVSSKETVAIGGRK